MYPLHQAAKIGNLTEVNHLLAVHEADANARTDYGATPLVYAAFGGHALVISVLLSAGADVNAEDTTPLHYAVSVGRIPAVSMLLAAGANVNAQNGINDTPLHYLVYGGDHSSIASILIAAGAELETQGNSGAPLHHAAHWGRQLVVSVLLATGANVNAKRDDGKTPLHQAAGNGKATIASMLLAAGADANAKDNNGRTPLYWAIYFDNPSVIPVLTAAGAQWDEVCTGAAIVNPARHNPPCLCESPNVGSADDCQAPSAESCGGLMPPKFYNAAAGECVSFSECAPSTALNAETNLCENCGELTPPEFYDAAAKECVPFLECATPSVLNAETNLCDCPAPNVGTNEANAPGDCIAPSVENCAGLTPSKFYDSTAEECAEFKGCLSGATLNRGENICECASPSVLDGTGLGCEFTLESCAAANLHYNGANCEPLADCAAPSTRNQSTNQCEFTLESCTAANLHYNGTNCEPLANCAPPSTRNESTNQCECHSPNLGTGGDCQAPSAESCAEFYNPPRFYDASAGECGARLYPCHDSAIRKADNSGCECPPGTYAHGDPSGGSHYHIPDTAICHADHAPISHNLNGWLDSIRADNPTLILHFVSQHGESPNQLVYAVNNSASRAIKILIERGANVDQQDSRGDTPLHLAARRADSPENAALVSFLLDKGANPNIFNNNRWRPLDLADGRDGYPRRRKIMSALIAGGANWSDECIGGKVPNEFTPPKCKCPARLSIDNNGLCECPGHSHSQVNGLCLPKDSAQVEGEIAKMRVELARLRAALVSLNARISLSAEMPREMVEGIAEQARETAAEIDWRRANFVALGRTAEAGEAPPPVALSDTAAECRMRGGEVRIDSGSGTRICLGLDRSGTFCLVDSGDAFPCRGLFKHVRRCNDVYHRPALNAFICGERCGADETARGRDCE